MDFEKSAHDLHVLKPEATVGDYLDFIEALMQFDVETEQGAGWADAVQVSTIYQAKGDEFDYVFVIDVAPTSLPLNYIDKPYYVPKELAKGLFTLATKDERKNFAENEERRVLYVGMTRAVEKLFVTYPIAYPAGGHRNPSKFIAPLLRNFNVKPYIETPKPFSAKETPPQASKKMKPIEIKKNEKPINPHLVWCLG
jgi:superfamily I DNA/RNA helicase